MMTVAVHHRRHSNCNHRDDHTPCKSGCWRLAMDQRSFLIVLCVLLWTYATTEGTTHTGNETHRLDQVTLITTEFSQNFAKSGNSMYTLSSPWDHITKYFSDFNSQVVALNSEFCGRTCTFIHERKANIENGNCDACSCDENCYETGDCCPDLVLLHNKTKHSGVDPGCIQNEIPMNKANDFYLMIASCPATYEPSFIKAKCENASVTNWLDVVPRVNGDTRTSLRNIYCAECNGLNNTSSWSTSITCSSFDPALQKVTSRSELFNTVMRSKTCNIQFYPPAGTQRCRYRPAVVIGRCNVTGLWLDYDKNVDIACNMFSHVVFGTYRNIFCYYCNDRINWHLLLQKTISDGLQSPMTMPLTALIDFDNTWEYRQSGFQDAIVMGSVNSSQSMVSFLKQCYNQSVSCAEGKQLNADQCQSLLTASNMIGYRMCFQENITITKQLEVASDIRHLIQQHQPFVNSKVIQMANRTSYVLQIQNCPHKEMYLIVRYVLLIYSTNPLNRDDLEKQLLEENKMIVSDSNAHVLYHAGCSSNTSPAQTQGNVHQCSWQFNEFVFTQTFPVLDYSEQIVKRAKYIQLSKQLICPRVVLNSSEYVISFHGNTSDNGLNKTLQFPTLVISSTQTILEHSKFQELHGGSVVVCISDYMNATFKTPYYCNDKQYVTRTNPLGIFSFVCTSISLLFLAITFITYCMFASMRTVGGVCNMGLLATLFAAQAVFEFGIEQNEDVIGCQVIGIIIHFLWLAAVLWMNASTFLLFVKLSFPLRSRNFGHSRKKIFCLSALYSNGMSALAVCLNIILNLASHGNIGYGGSACYMNTIFSKTYFFKVPMGIIVVVNIGLFVFTICRIRRNVSVNSTRDSKINMLACVKLSVITGLVWLFSYLYEVFQITAFAYLFTLFVGAQGVLFFLAIVINRNTLSLWSNYFGGKFKNTRLNSKSTTLSESLTKLSKTSHRDSHDQQINYFKTSL